MTDPDEARAVLAASDAWIGWEMWEMDRDAICLDGHFTIAELEALLVLLKEPA